MKQKISVLFSAIGGGIIAMGAYHLFIPKQQINIIQEAPKSQQVFNPLIPPNMDFTTASEKTVNAVVHITTVSKITNTRYSNPFDDFFFGNPFGGGGRNQPQTASGSGVIISDDGYIVTNNHVIDGAEEIEVTLNDKRSFKGKLVGKDPNTDIAVLKIQENNLPFVSFANSDDLKVGEWVLAVGNPFNLTSTVTAGIVSAKGRNIDIIQQNYKIESFIQTDAAVNPGNSGGALVNTNGELVGINTAIQTHTGSFEGYSFAVPSNLVKKISKDLIEFGTVQRGLLGVSLKEINADFANDKGLSKIEGVYVEAPQPGSAAEEAGIQPGDIILKVGEVNVNSVSQLQEHIGLYRPGDKVSITIKRGSSIKTVNAILKNKSGDTSVVKAPTGSNNLLGATFDIADESTLTKLNLKNGVEVIEVTGGKLRSAGIRSGFIITEINGKPIKTPSDVDQALESSKGYYVIGGMYPSGEKVFYSFN